MQTSITLCQDPILTQSEKEFIRSPAKGVNRMVHTKGGIRVNPLTSHFFPLTRRIFFDIIV